jgi:hypothetical protein
VSDKKPSKPPATKPADPGTAKPADPGVTNKSPFPDPTLKRVHGTNKNRPRPRT